MLLVSSTRLNSNNNLEHENVHISLGNDSSFMEHWTAVGQASHTRARVRIHCSDVKSCTGFFHYEYLAIYSGR